MNKLFEGVKKDFSSLVDNGKMNWDIACSLMIISELRGISQSLGWLSLSEKEKWGGMD